MSTLVALVRACHPGPTVVVTALAAGLGGRAGLEPLTLALVVAAVFCGQLTIGWGNDLLDAGRDRAAGRADKPLADGALSPTVVATAIAAAGVGTLVLSMLLGLPAAVVHVVLVVGSGWAYDLVLKRTLVSFVPYAIAFGALPTVPTLAATPPTLPPLWMLWAGALLGVGAHAVNVLPDLADDAATGVRGLPHALGERGARLLAAVSLFGGCLAAAVGGMSPAAGLVVGLLGAALSALTLFGSGRTPFRAAMALAALVVLALLTA
ncbi:UbiA family prenyltransferase [Mobilicoccus sp.]|uniref:UbiA family prenyltransferase n=1 Tax=Mobilicoccus sp. TaxID=2034349 RepID=UPI0028B03A2D|nr:UbiA family prenyltransferase [Mobilicoccus sp.]